LADFSRSPIVVIAKGEDQRVLPLPRTGEGWGGGACAATFVPSVPTVISTEAEKSLARRQPSFFTLVVRRIEMDNWVWPRGVGNPTLPSGSPAGTTNGYDFVLSPGGTSGG